MRAETTHGIPLHRVLGRDTAKLADGDRRILGIAEAVGVRRGAPEDLALCLERLVEASRSGGRRAGRRRWRGGSRRWRRSRLALRVVVVFLHASAPSIADGGTNIANALMHTAEHTSMRIPLQVRTPPADGLLVALQRNHSIENTHIDPRRRRRWPEPRG